MRRFAGLGALALAAGAMMSQMGCSSTGEGGEDENTGVAQVAISQVPFDGSVGCIAVTATGTHAKTQSVDVAPGQSTVIDMNGLPVGTVSFVGNAYQGPCASVTPASAPTWISDAVLASVNNVQPVMVHLSMHRSGQADVDVDFQDEPSCRADGTPCLSNWECCSQSCVAGACSSAPPACGPGLVSCNGGCADLMNDPSNCGACGLQCPFGMACQFGACLGPSCWNGFQDGMETSVDCGGPQCPACATGQGCLTGSDCQSNVCFNGICATPSCFDTVKNGAETDIDCGGPCAPCAQGKTCMVDIDCAAGFCLNGVCEQALQCQTPLDCPGVDTDCQLRTCTGGVCGMVFVAAGTPVSAQTAGDCLVTECDGAGGVFVTPDYIDVPEDNNQCTIDMCGNIGPYHVPVPAGTPCNQNGGAMCDGNGNCI